MTQALRVGTRLPPDRRDNIVRYLQRQPLLPTWKLAVVSTEANATPSSLIHLLVTTPPMLHLSPEPLGCPHTPAVLIIEREASHDLLELIGRAGVRGVVFADDPPATLALGIAAAASYGVWVPEAVWRSLAPGLTPEVSEAFGSLTVAEEETLQLLARGMTNKEIARARRVQVSTVKYHVGNIRLKTGAASRHELIVQAHHVITAGARAADGGKTPLWEGDIPS